MTCLFMLKDLCIKIELRRAPPTFWDRPAPPPTKADRRATADIMKLAHSSMRWLPHRDNRRKHYIVISVDDSLLKLPKVLSNMFSWTLSLRLTEWHRWKTGLVNVQQKFYIWKQQMIENQNVPTSIRCLATDSPPINLSPVTLFRYRFSFRRIYFRIDSPPGDYILKQSLRGGRETISSPVKINSPRRRVYFDAS